MPRYPWLFSFLWHCRGWTIPKQFGSLLWTMVVYSSWYTSCPPWHVTSNVAISVAKVPQIEAGYQYTCGIPIMPYRALTMCECNHGISGSSEMKVWSHAHSADLTCEHFGGSTLSKVLTAPAVFLVEMMHNWTLNPFAYGSWLKSDFCADSSFAWYEWKQEKCGWHCVKQGMNGDGILGMTCFDVELDVLYFQRFL